MMAERGLSFKEAVNTALRSALTKRGREPFRTRTFSMGPGAVPLDQALRLAADLEDAEIQRKLSLGK
jgi:hypothetical protein